MFTTPPLALQSAAIRWDFVTAWNPAVATNRLGASVVTRGGWPGWTAARANASRWWAPVNDDVLSPLAAGADAPWGARAATVDTHGRPLVYEYGGREFDLTSAVDPDAPGIGGANQTRGVIIPLLSRIEQAGGGGGLTLLLADPTDDTGHAALQISSAGASATATVHLAQLVIVGSRG